MPRLPNMPISESIYIIFSYLLYGGVLSTMTQESGGESALDAKV
jgi:hypothetical protein